MTRILIATNEPILAKGLETVLTAGGLEIAAVCHDVFELFERLPRCRPDIAVLDMTVLPAPGGISPPPPAPCPPPRSFPTCAGSRPGASWCCGLAWPLQTRPPVWWMPSA